MQTSSREENYDESKSRAITYLISRAVSRRNIPNYVIDSTRDYSISETKRILNVSGKYILVLAKNKLIKIIEDTVDGFSLDSLCREIFSGLESRVNTKMHSGKGRKICNKSEDDSPLVYQGDDYLSAYFRRIRHYNLLSIEEEIEYVRRAREGDEEARERLINSNLKFVVSVSKEYQGLGLTLSELISEGNMGLFKAVERFDETKGFKFITYAVWWIRQAIMEKLANSRIVRVPINRKGDLLRINKTIERLSDSRGTLDSQRLIEDVASELNMDPELVEYRLSIAQKEVSFDKPVGDSDDPLIDMFPDTSQKSPDDDVNISSLRETIRHCMDCLDSREARILQLYYGLSGEKALTLDKIGVREKLTRERVRQLKERALSKLRHPDQIRILKDYQDFVY